MTAPRRGPNGERLKPRRKGVLPVPVVDRTDGSARLSLSRLDGSCAWVTFDLADLEKVISHTWWQLRLPGRETSYAATTAMVDGRAVTLLMHRILMDAPESKLVDHADGDGLNNRRANLRLATNSQNRANEVNPRAKTATSPYKGVEWKAAAA